MLQAAERPLIVAGGGIINADASELLVEFAELTGMPVIPTLMGWGAIPDDHPLMAGMCGLQTSHRYGNANMLASDSCSASATAGRTATPARPRCTARGASSSTSTSSRRRSAASSRPTRHRLRRQGGAAAVRRGGARVEGGRQAARTAAGWVARMPGAQAHRCLRKTNFDSVPMKPQRVYQCMNNAFGRDMTYVSTIGLSQIAGAQFLHVYRPAPLDQLRPGRPARLDDPGRARRARGRPDAQDRRAVGRLRLPVHDRRAGRRARSSSCPTSTSSSTTATSA